MERLIWRVEKRDHTGPYRTEENAVFLSDMGHDDPMTHPTPIQDGANGCYVCYVIGFDPTTGKSVHTMIERINKRSPILGLEDNWRFGFRDLDQARDWFAPDAVSYLDAQGYCLQAYVAPPHLKGIVKGEKQIVWPAEDIGEPVASVPVRVLHTPDADRLTV